MLLPPDEPLSKDDLQPLYDGKNLLSIPVITMAHQFQNTSSEYFLGGLSLHLNHLIGSRMTNYDWPFGTLPLGIFWSNLDTMDLETYPRTCCGHF